jgi:hypothetical protein
MSVIHLPFVRAKTLAWSKGRIIDQKRPLQPKRVWATIFGQAGFMTACISRRGNMRVLC